MAGYRIVSSSSDSQLEEWIMKYAREGWEIHGNLCVGRMRCYQVMIKWGEDGALYGDTVEDISKK